MSCVVSQPPDLYLELMLRFDLLPEWSRERQQPALVDVETAIVIATDDVEGERRAVLGRVFVRHHELEDAAAD